jgi:hypothetical protein
MTDDQEAVLSMVDNGLHKEALKAIENLGATEQEHGRIRIAKGDAFYELRDDLAALQSYAGYAEEYPTGRGLGFALFGIAMCLKNLDLQPEALAVLNLISPGHVGLEKELEHSNQLLAKQAKATSMIDGLLSKLRKVPDPIE